MTRLLLLTLALGSPARADEPPIGTDRPGFLYSPVLVPEGRFQVEAGAPTYARSGDGAARAWSLPVALRYGLTSTVELRASLPAWTDAFLVDGFADAEVGAKLALGRDAGAPLALQMTLRLPSGSDGVTTGEVGGSVHLLHARALGAGFALTGMLGATAAPADDGPDAVSGAIAALVTAPLAGDLSGYVELAALPGLHEARGQSHAGAALIWTARADLQLDLSADFGLDDDAADVIAAFGASLCW